MKLSDFSLVDEGDAQAELRDLVVSFNRTAADYPRHRTVHARFSEQAARTPAAAAVLEGERIRTYAEVEERSNRLARVLMAHGLEKENFVGVMVDGAFDLVTTLLGILKAGGAYLPLDPKLPETRLEYLLQDTRARFLVGGRRHIRLLNRLQWSGADVGLLLCPDSRDIHAESEGVGDLMREDVWDLVGREIFDDISGGGWKSSYTGEWLSREVMDQYGENIRAKLAPLIDARSRILEIGCSSGISLFRLAPIAGYYLGTDLSGEILKWTRSEVEKRGLGNVRLEHLPAHAIDRAGERDFDLVIINSVIQCFSGHNYLRGVLRQAIDLMAERGVIFLGHILDQELRGEFRRGLDDFRRAHAGQGYRTHAEHAEDLFVPRAFWQDLQAEWPEIAGIEFSRLQGTVESELTRFGYDAIVRIDKTTSQPAQTRTRRQRDERALDAAPAGPLPERSGPESLAYAIYTSGTTGQPKGVLVEHRPILRLVLNTNYIRLGPQDRILMTGDLSFDASTFEIWGPLLNGGALCRPPEHAVLDAAAMKELIRRHGVTTLFLTTGLFNQLVDADIELFAGLQTLLTGGERMSVRHINLVRARYPELALSNVYGPTENTTFSTYYPITGPQAADVPIGWPIANTTVYILDANLAPVPPGAAGEIFTGGEGLARGYLHDPELTREKFVPDPFQPGGRLYRTGDLGRWREDGAVEFVGRKDFQVKVRGFRIELGEIEACLARHEAVKEAVVIASQPGGGGSLELAAYVRCAEPVTPGDLRAYLEHQLPAYMIPAHVTVMDAFPLTPNGKVDRRALPPPERTRDDTRERVPPATEVERQLVAIWEEVLGQTGLGVTDNFFAVGGHSLKVTRLVALMRERLAVDLPLAAVFKAATVREQARVVLAAARFGVEGFDEPVVKLNDGAGPPIFALPPGTGDAIGYLQVAQCLRPYAFYGFNFIEAETRWRDYADWIQRLAPGGPWVLLGYSAGGNLAYHVAAELERRGGRVAGVIMVDSGRVCRPIAFPPGEVERVTAEFLDHESIRAHVANPVLREKAARLIETYYGYVARTLDTPVIQADICGLVAASSGEHYDADGHLVVSRRGWREATRGRYTEVCGQGDHNHLLSPPYVESNAAHLRAFCEHLFSSEITISANALS